MLLATRNAHPRDEKITFEEIGHKYTIEGMNEKPISVTTLIHNFFPVFNSNLVCIKMMKSPKWPESNYFEDTKKYIKNKLKKKRIIEVFNLILDSMIEEYEDPELVYLKSAKRKMDKMKNAEELIDTLKNLISLADDSELVYLNETKDNMRKMKITLDVDALIDDLFTSSKPSDDLEETKKLFKKKIRKELNKRNAEVNLSEKVDKLMRSPKWPKSKYFKMAKEHIKKGWAKSGKEASNLGTLMHADIELFLNNENPLKPASIEFSYFLKFWKEFIEEHPGFGVFRTEWLIYDEVKKLAGSIDCVLTNEEGEVIILDWKRSKEIKKKNKFEKGLGPFSTLENCNYNHYMLQLNIYRHVLETKYDKRVVGMYIVVLHPDNETYLIFPIDRYNISKIWNSLFSDSKKSKTHDRD